MLHHPLKIKLKKRIQQQYNKKHFFFLMEFTKSPFFGLIPREKNISQPPVLPNIYLQILKEFEKAKYNISLEISESKKQHDQQLLERENQHKKHLQELENKHAKQISEMDQLKKGFETLLKEYESKITILTKELERHTQDLDDDDFISLPASTLSTSMQVMSIR